jgi:hypothetical protein
MNCGIIASARSDRIRRGSAKRLPGQAGALGAIHVMLEWVLSKSEINQVSHRNYIKVLDLANSLPVGASMKIQFLFHIIHIVLMIPPDILLGSFLRLPCPCRNIASLFSDTILLKTKK